VIAAVGASVGGLLLPKQYSATASILIEPPIANDPRATTAVSPIYLESLKTYEHFANSNSLFARAVEQFHLRSDAKEPLEGLKRRVLKVSKLRDTKILEIKATLPDPKKAAEVTAFLARETAALSESVGRDGDQDRIESSQARLDAAEKAVAASRDVLEREDRQEPINSLKYDVESLMEVRAGVQRDLLATRADSAETPSDARVRRIGELEKQIRDLDSRIRERNDKIAKRTIRRSVLQNEFETASRDRDALREQVRNLRGNAGTSGERLRVIDSGVIPQEPSFPNIPLMVVSAVVLALAASLLYLAAGFGIERRRFFKALEPSAEHARERI
jgi:uncharacterized protein involved in exopolysaccharide biosynthesis